MTQDTIYTMILKALSQLGWEAPDFVVEHPTDLSHGDYSTNVALILSKKLGKNPREIATELSNALKKTSADMVERIEVAGPGFINFYLSKEFFREALKYIIKEGKDFGENKNLKGQKFLVEHTQPNPFKEFHIGHLMNNATGEAIARILKFSGAKVKTATYHGDVGMHVAMALWRGDYAVGAKAYKEDPEAKLEIEAINRKIYDGSDSEINKKYKEGRKKSLEKFEVMYKRLGSTFDYHFFESEAGVIGKEIVLKNIGPIFEESEGAIVYKGEKDGLHTRVFLNSDRLPTYEGKEVGLAKIKKKKYSYDQSITITANEQDAFFKVVEVVIGKVFKDLAGKLKHLSHGILRLTTGKMSSRTGDVITAENLIEEVKEKVKGNEEVAIGAIKYMILRSNIGGDIIFDVEKSVSTEGDSGVYLQYAHARANSVLEKANNKPNTKGEQGEVRVVEKLLYRFPEIISRAQKEYAPHYITFYLTELAGAFNNFYAHEQVNSDEPQSQYRLAIVEAFKIVMRNGLNVLGIPAPERM